MIQQVQADQAWLALVIGNSRLHWAWFAGKTLQSAWEIDQNQVPITAIEATISQWAAGNLPDAIFPRGIARDHLIQFCHGSESSLDWQISQLPLYLASVVPAQTAIWQNYPLTQAILPAHLPLKGLYPTLGIDRALAVMGAGTQLGWPVLVIDAGTALTFTGGDANRELKGGAILPGLGLQLHSLAEHTAALPLVEMRNFPALPTRWARDTAEAIESGIVYTLLAGIRDFIRAWRQDYPDSAIAFTGGDSTTLLTYLQSQDPELVQSAIADPHLIFWGMSAVVNRE